MKGKRILVFDGGGLTYRWMIQVEQCFYVERALEYEKLPAAIGALEGCA